MDIGMTRQEITAALHETVRRNGMTEDVHLRLITVAHHPNLPASVPPSQAFQAPV